MTDTTQSSKLVLQAYAVSDAQRGKKAYWTRIGRLFAHDDAKGYDLLLNALPVNGRVVIRQEEARDQAE